MEKLTYTIDDRTITELLGVENFSTKESAILELVKNAYDALSEKVDINFENNKIVIRDYGIGMNESDIREHWMHVGKSKKGYSIQHNLEKRVLSGSKGIGRFALARLGRNAKVITCKKGNNPIIWETDWDNTTMHRYEGVFSYGTEIVITDLGDRWLESTIKRLSEYLSLTYNDDKMKVFVSYNGNLIKEVKKRFSDIHLGINCVSKISLRYDSFAMTLHCEIESDEFLPESRKYTNRDIKYSSSVTNMSIELVDKVFSNEVDNLENALIELGDFQAEFYFSLGGNSEKDIEKFLYKYKTLQDRIYGGIILYRNAFSISSYEGKKDWLEINKRARLSPAAATHPTGSWRVRGNQITGKVIIDKNENKGLKDLSNRQGLDENIYYELFTVIIQEGISQFEEYRQLIIRDINEKNKTSIPLKKETITSRVAKNPESVKDLSNDEIKELVSEIESIEQENKKYKSEFDDTEKRYKYDIRILNVLATLGLRATSIAHELRNSKNKLGNNSQNIIEALKEYGYWEELNSPECTEYSDKNVPDLINQNEKINQRMIVFMNTMLEENEKQKFNAKNIQIYLLLCAIKKVWEYDYSWIDIQLNMDKNLFFSTSEDIMNVIFDNLILNSIQQNENSTNLIISINFSIELECLKVIYRDNGNGLHEKYKKDPLKILNVHESSRKNGHGLGMWMINNTLNLTNGYVKEIADRDGFYIEFLIGRDLK